MAGGNDSGGSDGAFISRTLRSAAFVTAFVLFVLASYGQFWALLPLAAGTLLAVALLWGMSFFVRRAFTPERARQARENSGAAGPGRALLVFALVKYPLIALIIWAVTRFWRLEEVMAFAGGFMLLHAVIGLRAMGRYLVDQMAEKSSVPGGPGASRNKE